MTKYNLIQVNREFERVVTFVKKDKRSRNKNGGLRCILPSIYCSVLKPKQTEGRTGDIVKRWKEYIRDLFNPADTPSLPKAEAEDFGWDCPSPTLKSLR